MEASQLVAVAELQPPEVDDGDRRLAVVSGDRLVGVRGAEVSGWDMVAAGGRHHGLHAWHRERRHGRLFSFLHCQMPTVSILCGWYCSDYTVVDIYGVCPIIVRKTIEEIFVITCSLKHLKIL